MSQVPEDFVRAACPTGSRWRTGGACGEARGRRGLGTI